MTARFEVVRGDEPAYPWFARFIAANGRTVWVTETYDRRGGAFNAIVSIAKALGITAAELVENVPGREWILRSALTRNTTSTGFGLMSVLLVDERSRS